MVIYYKTGYQPGSSEKLLRAVLQDYASKADGNGACEKGNSGSFQIERQQHAKPYVPGRPDITFSVTHTQDWWICAVGNAGDGPLGIDAEKKTRPVKKPTALARRFFRGEEAARVAKAESGADAGQPVQASASDLFLNIWIRKEAYLKYTGEGLFGLSGNCTVTFGGQNRMTASDGVMEDEAVEFISIELDKDLYVVLCRRRESKDKEYILCRLT